MKQFSLYVMMIVMFGLLLVPGSFSGSIKNSKHNLSVSGPGEIKSSGESQICIFCHSSHNASGDGPLWGHQTTQPGKFKTYTRSTMDSQPEQPNGSTKLCLSCHDGTIAVGAIRGLNQPIHIQNVGSGGEIPATKKSNLGTDLTGTHPVSVKFDQNVAMTDRKLRWPPTDPEKAATVDADSYVQCTSCHDPHDDSKSEKYPFWNKATFDEVCQSCHNY